MWASRLSMTHKRSIRVSSVRISQGQVPVAVDTFKAGFWKAVPGPAYPLSSSQLKGGKSLGQQTTDFGHCTPGQNGPPHTHWVKVTPLQRA
jgi:hypothetical protein